MKTASQVLAQTPGLTYRKLDHWTKLGHLHAVGEAEGSGRPRQYTDSEARVGWWMVHLAEAGFTLPTAAALARTHVRTARQESDHQIAGRVRVTLEGMGPV